METVPKFSLPPKLGDAPSYFRVTEMFGELAFARAFSAALSRGL
jgi:hypothetical protein